MKLIFLFGAVLLFSCSSRSKIKNPFYYQAQKADRIIHILGTMHVGFQLKDFHEQIQKDLSMTEVVAVEADEDLIKMYREGISRKYLAYVQKHALTPYHGLQKKFSAEAWKNLTYTLSMDDVRKSLEKAKVTTDVLELNPILIQVIVDDLVKREQWYAFSDVVKQRWKNQDLRWMFFDSFNRVDQEILSSARSNQKEVMILDRFSDEILENLSDFEKSTLTNLENTFGDNTLMAKKFQANRSDYQKGNEAALVSIMGKEAPEEFQIRERNQEWLSKLKWRLEKDMFAAVGAGHLVGKDSLLLMLEKEGFKVTKVELSID